MSGKAKTADRGRKAPELKTVKQVHAASHERVLVVDLARNGKRRLEWRAK